MVPMQLIWVASWPRTHGRRGGLWDRNPGCPGPVFPTSLLLLRLCLLHGGHSASHRSGPPTRGRMSPPSRAGWSPHPLRGPPNPELQSRDRNLRSVYPAGWLSLFSTQCFHLRTAPSRETPRSRTRRRPGGRGPGEGLTLQRVQTLLHHARESPLGYTDRRGTGRKDGSRDYRCDLKFPSTYRVPGTPKDPTPWAPDEPEDWALGGEA